MKRIEWQKVKDFGTDKPKTVDLSSSPTTVYLNRNVARQMETDEDGNQTEFWLCDRAEMSAEEYEAYKENEGVFTTPEFMELKEQLEEQGTALMEMELNSEYSVCLQEMEMQGGQ